MKKFVSALIIIAFTAIFPGDSFAHRGTLDELGGHFRNADCVYLLHEPTSIAMQAKNKAELAQLIKKHNSNSKCVQQLTVDKIDLQGHTLGGTASPAAPSSKQSSSLQLGKKYRAKLVSCIDGDTARFIVNGREYTTRFLFIDTPESTIQIEPYGKEASRFTCSRLSRGNITLETDGNTLFDKYHRLLAWVWVGNKLLQEEIAKAGLVEDFYDYGDYKYEGRVRAAMDKAKQSGAGMYGASSKTTSANHQTTINEKNNTESKESAAKSLNNEPKKQQAEANKQSDQKTNEKETSDSNTKHPIFYLLALAFIVAFFYFFKWK